MSIHFTSMTVSQITDRAHKLMDEGSALAKLAAALVEFEEATGRKLFLSEADQGTSYVGQGGSIVDRGPEIVAPAIRADRGLTVLAMLGEVDTPVEPMAEAAPAPEPIKKESPANAAPVAAKPAGGQKAIKKSSAPSTSMRKVDTAPPAPTKPQPTERPWGALNLAERRIVKHLEGLPRTFTAAEDASLVEMLAHGNKIEVVAALLEVSREDALERWNSFLTEDVVGANGKPSIDGQKQLLTALRYRSDAADA